MAKQPPSEPHLTALVQSLGNSDTGYFDICLLIFLFIIRRAPGSSPSIPSPYTSCAPDLSSLLSEVIVSA